MSDAAADRSEGGTAFATGTALTALAGMGCAALWACYFLLFVVPTYMPLFESMGMALPTATASTVHLSVRSINYWFILFPVGLCLLLGLGWAVFAAGRIHGVLGAATAAVLLCITLACCFFLRASLELPLRQAVQACKQPGGGLSPAGAEVERFLASSRSNAELKLLRQKMEVLREQERQREQGQERASGGDSGMATETGRE